MFCRSGRRRIPTTQNPMASSPQASPRVSHSLPALQRTEPRYTPRSRARHTHPWRRCGSSLAERQSHGMLFTIRRRHKRWPWQPSSIKTTPACIRSSRMLPQRRIDRHEVSPPYLFPFTSAAKRSAYPAPRTSIRAPIRSVSRSLFGSRQQDVGQLLHRRPRSLCVEIGSVRDGLLSKYGFAPTGWRP